MINSTSKESRLLILMGLNHHECLHNHPSNHEFGTLLWVWLTSNISLDKKSTDIGIGGRLVNTTPMSLVFLVLQAIHQQRWKLLHQLAPSVGTWFPHSERFTFMVLTRAMASLNQWDGLRRNPPVVTPEMYAALQQQILILNKTLQDRIKNSVTNPAIREMNHQLSNQDARNNNSERDDEAEWTMKPGEHLSARRTIQIPWPPCKPRSMG